MAYLDDIVRYLTKDTQSEVVMQYNGAIEMRRRGDGTWVPKRRSREPFVVSNSLTPVFIGVDYTGAEPDYTIVDECGPVPAALFEPTNSRSVGSFESEIERVRTLTGRFKRRWAARRDRQLESVRRAIRSIPFMAGIAAIELLRVVR